MRITVTGGMSPLGSERGGSPLTAIVALGEMTAPAVVLRRDHRALAPQRARRAVRPEDHVLRENVRALAYAAERGGSEAIFGNIAGNLCEGTGPTCSWCPAGSCSPRRCRPGCLAGVTRALVIEWAGAAEQDLPLSALADADEAFLTGTTRDVQPIRCVDGRALPAAPGPVTAKAAEVFAMRARPSPSDPQ